MEEIKALIWPDKLGDADGNDDAVVVDVLVTDRDLVKWPPRSSEAKSRRTLDGVVSDIDPRGLRLEAPRLTSDRVRRGVSPAGSFAKQISSASVDMFSSEAFWSTNNPAATGQAHACHIIGKGQGAWPLKRHLFEKT